MDAMMVNLIEEGESREVSRYQAEKWLNEQKGKNYWPTPLTCLNNNQKADMVTSASKMRKMVGE